MGLCSGLCTIESNQKCKMGDVSQETQYPDADTDTEAGAEWCYLFNTKNTPFLQSVEVGTHQIQKSTQTQANKSRRGENLHYKTGSSELNPQP